MGVDLLFILVGLVLVLGNVFVDEDDNEFLVLEGGCVVEVFDGVELGVFDSMLTEDMAREGR